MSNLQSDQLRSIAPQDSGKCTRCGGKKQRTSKFSRCSACRKSEGIKYRANKARVKTSEYRRKRANACGSGTDREQRWLKPVPRIPMDSKGKSLIPKSPSEAIEWGLPEYQSHCEKHGTIMRDAVQRKCKECRKQRDQEIRSQRNNEVTTCQN